MCALSHLDGAPAHRLHLLPTSDSNSAPLIHDRGAAGSPEISGWVRYFLSTGDYLSLPRESRKRDIPVLVSTRAVAIWINCRLFKDFMVHPDSKEFQQSSLEVTNSWTNFSASFCDRICLIFAMLRR